MQHTQTRIYRRSLELATLARLAIESLPRGFASLADQLRRAAGSVTENFAEGCGKRTARDRRRYFDTARGSAYEVAAAFDVGVALGALEPELAERASDIADHLGAMLYKYR